MAKNEAIARLVDGSVLDLEFSDAIIRKLKDLQAQGLTGKRLIHQLYTDDWGPPPRYVTLKGTTSGGESIDIRIVYD